MSLIGRRRAVIGALVGLLVVFVPPIAAQAAERDVFVDVVINGTRIEGGGLIVGDRTYVRVDDVAAVLGGSVIRDPELNLVFVNAGNYANLTLSRLKKLNPELAAYSAMSAFVPATGIRHGVPGPHIAVTTTPAGVVTGVVLVVPEAAGVHFPWYDQQKGNPVELSGIGRVYTQQVFFIDRTLVRPSLALELVFNGERLWVPEGAFLWRANELYVRLRDLAEASGGGVGWDQENRVASAKVVPGRELAPETLAAFNPRLEWHYEVREPLSARGGLELRPLGPGLAFGLDASGAVTGWRAVFPEEAGWFRWFDQKEGSSILVTDFGRVYSQSLTVSEAAR